MNWTFNVSIDQGQEPPVDLNITSLNVTRQASDRANVTYNATGEDLADPWLLNITAGVWDRFLKG